jgi:hypothetical protein
LRMRSRRRCARSAGISICCWRRLPLVVGIIALVTLNYRQLVRAFPIREGRCAGADLTASSSWEGTVAGRSGRGRR